MSNARTIHKTFSRETTVSIIIDADVDTIWKLLTNVKDFPEWNSTILSMQGEIKEGKSISFVTALDKNKTVKFKVKTFKPQEEMVWGDRMGTRSFYLTPESNNKTRFVMKGKIAGLIYPLIASKIPSFDESFNRFATDLKVEAERRSS